MLEWKRKLLPLSGPQVAAAVAGGAIVGGVASGALGAKGAKDAAGAQADAARESAQLQYDMYQQQREDQEPFRQTGLGALNQLAYRLGIGVGSGNDLLRRFSMDDFQADPGYQFRLEQGQKGIESSAAARGGLLSGAAAKALTKYNQGFASNEYQNAYNRFNNDQSTLFNRLASLSGVGQTSTNAVQQAGQNYASGAGNALQYGGAARASGYTGAANAISGGLGSVSGGLIGYGNMTGWGNTGGYGGATSYPVTDYYSGVSGTPIA